MAKRNGRVKVVQQRHPRAVETDPGPPFPFAWLLAATGLVIVAIAVVALVAPGQDGVDDPIDGVPDPVDEGPMVIIPLSEISDQVRWFDYPVGGVVIRFFAVLDGGGKIHAGLDACEVCYQAKKGFHQENDMIQCNSCGKLAPIAGVGHNSGECWPGPLPARIEGEEVLVSVQALQDGVYMFV